MCDLNSSYLIGDFKTGLFLYNQNLDLLNNNSYFTGTKRYIVLKSNDNIKELYVSEENGIRKVDLNLNQLNSVSESSIGGVRGIWYNSSTDEIHLFNQDYSKVYLFNRNLNLTGYYNVTYKNTYLTEKNGIIFLASTSGEIMMIQNKITKTFSNVAGNCNIMSLLVDNYDKLAVLCSSDNKIYIYNTNGSFTGLSWSSPVVNATNMVFDAFGNFILTNNTGIYFFN